MGEKLNQWETIYRSEEYQTLSEDEKTSVRRGFLLDNRSKDKDLQDEETAAYFVSGKVDKAIFDNDLDSFKKRRLDWIDQHKGSGKSLSLVMADFGRSLSPEEKQIAAALENREQAHNITQAMFHAPQQSVIGLAYEKITDRPLFGKTAYHDYHKEIGYSYSPESTAEVIVSGAGGMLLDTPVFGAASKVSMAGLGISKAIVQKVAPKFIMSSRFATSLQAGGRLAPVARYTSALADNAAVSGGSFGLHSAAFESLREIAPGEERDILGTFGKGFTTGAIVGVSSHTVNSVFAKMTPERFSARLSEKLSKTDNKLKWLSANVAKQSADIAAGTTAIVGANRLLENEHSQGVLEELTISAGQFTAFKMGHGLASKGFSGLRGLPRKVSQRNKPLVEEMKQLRQAEAEMYKQAAEYQKNDYSLNKYLEGFRRGFGEGPEGQSFFSPENFMRPEKINLEGSVKEYLRRKDIVVKKALELGFAGNEGSVHPELKGHIERLIFGDTYSAIKGDVYKKSAADYVVENWEAYGNFASGKNVDFAVRERSMIQLPESIKNSLIEAPSHTAPHDVNRIVRMFTNSKRFAERYLNNDVKRFVFDNMDEATHLARSETQKKHLLHNAWTRNYKVTATGKEAMIRRTGGKSLRLKMNEETGMYEGLGLSFSPQEIQFMGKAPTLSKADYRDVFIWRTKRQTNEEGHNVGIETLRKMGVKDQEIREVETKLSPTASDYIKWVDQNVFGDLLPRLNTMRMVAGHNPVPVLADYFPLYRKGSQFGSGSFMYESIADWTKHNYSMTAPEKITYQPTSHAHERTITFRALESNPVVAVDKYIENMTRAIYLTPTVARIRDASKGFANPKTGEFWSPKAKNPLLYSVMTKEANYLTGQNTANQSPAMKSFNRILDKITKNTAVSLLGGYASTVINQIGAVEGSLVQTNAESVLYAATRYAIDPAYRRSLNENSKRYRDRMFDVWSNKPITKTGKATVKTREQGMTARNIAKDALETIGARRDWLAEASLKPMQMLDKVSAGISLGSSYHHLTKKLGWEPNNRETWKKAEEMMVKIQGSGESTDLAPVQQTSLGKFFTVFNTFGINKLNWMMYDMFGVKNAKVSKRAAINNFLRWGAYSSFVSAIYEQTGYYPGASPLTVYKAVQEPIETDDDIGRAMIAGAVELVEGFVPVTGGALKYSASSAFGANVALILDTYQAIGSMAKKRKDPNAKPWQYLLGRWSGIPFTQEVYKRVRYYDRNEKFFYDQQMAEYRKNRKVFDYKFENEFIKEYNKIARKYSNPEIIFRPSKDDVGNGVFDLMEDVFSGKKPMSHLMFDQKYKGANKK